MLFGTRATAGRRTVRVALFGSSPGAFRARHRLRKRQARLYWRLERPRLPKYVRAVVGIVACRVLSSS